MSAARPGDSQSNAGGAEVRRRRTLALVVVPFPPWGGGGVLRVTKLTKYLRFLGWRITVVTSDEVRPEVNDPTLLEQIPSDVNVIRVRGPFRAAGGAATTVARGTHAAGRLQPVIRSAKGLARAVLIPDRWIGWAVRAARVIAGGNDAPTIVLSSGPPHSAHVAGSLLAKRLRARHVVDLRDDWGDNPLHRHAAFWHAHVDRYIEDRVLRRADLVVMISNESRAALIARRPYLRNRVAVVPNGYDPADVASLPAREIPGPGRPAKYLYAGSLRSTQEVGIFFDAFAMAEGQPHPPVLTLVGYLSERHKELARRSIPSFRLSILEPEPHADALQRMAASDVLVVFTGGGGAGDATMTGKIFEYLALHRPILLVGPRGPAASLVVEVSGGVVADPFDREDLLAAIAKAESMARDPSFSGAPASSLRRFDRRVQAAEYSRLLDVVLRNGSGDER